MCGIFGMIGRLSPNRFNVARGLLTTLAIETEVRGNDATGYAAADGCESAIEFAKAALPATEFVKTKEWAEFMAQPVPAFVIGHTRFATTGSPKANENNHPFISSDNRLAMVHNGVICGHERIARSERLSLTTECDSEVILRVVEQAKSPAKGIKRVFSRVLKGWKADASVAMLDVKDHVVYLFRNTGRPCHVIRIPELDNVVVFASTAEILERSIKAVFGPKVAKRVMKAGFETRSYRIYAVTLDGEEGPDITSKAIPVSHYETGSVFADSLPAPSRYVPASTPLTYHGLNSDDYSQSELWPQGWEDMPPMSEVECGCGRVTKLMGHSTMVCPWCFEFELDREIGAIPLDGYSGENEWLSLHCTMCGQSWSQKFIPATCIKCGAKRIEVTGAKSAPRKRNKQYAIWTCKCGKHLVTKGPPKRCPICGRKKTKHFRNDGTVTTEDLDKLFGSNNDALPGFISAVKDDMETLPAEPVWDDGEVSKHCHDCWGLVPGNGPSRCEPCREKRNRRRKEDRRRKW